MRKYNINHLREISKLGRDKIIESNHQKRKQNIKNYNNSPKLCKHCNSILPYDKRMNSFCSHNCSASHNNSGHCNNKFGYNGHPKKLSKVCKYCGKKTPHHRIFCNDICKTKYNEEQFLKRIQRKILSGEYIRRDEIRKYLIKTREYKCNKCQLSIWKNEPIPLESHHKDGNYKNNSEENLELICPNCHSITDSYRGKNRNNGRKEYKHQRR